MKKQIPLLISLIILALNNIIIHAQYDNRNVYNGPDFDTWSEIRIKQWEDSIKNVLYPSLEIRTAPKPLEIQKEGDIMKAGANNTYVPNSVTIDKTKAVGEIPMTSSVSPSGAIIYNVPVEVYPGVLGIQPQLSIAYNNQAGNGILGVGWNISGLSSINRGNRNMYYDGKTQGVVMLKDDAFYLDGIRLIKIGETATEVKYESEQGNIKATAYLNGIVVKYFNVFYPNGTKGTYGYTSNNLTNYLEFPVTSFSDLYGNTITYSYTYIDNYYRINNISYANASVEFQYSPTNRTDVITYYYGGTKVKKDKLLQKIICKYGSSVLRNYEFTYTFQKEASLLTKIGYSAANGASFNPLQFYYGENNTANAYSDAETQLLEWYVWTNKDQIRVCKGKFDYGSENDGLIVLPNKNSYWQRYTLVGINNWFENLYTGTEKIFLYAGLNSSYASPMPNLTTEAGFIDILSANIDGKWEEEVIKINNKVSGNNDQVIFKTYSANPYYGLSQKYTHTFNFPTVLSDPANNKSVHPKFYFTGDFNGDGKMEVLAVSCNNPLANSYNPTKCYLFYDLDTTYPKVHESQPFAYNVTFVGMQQTNPDIAAQNTDRLFVLDYDGDGKSDICLINSQGTYIYTFNVSGSSYSVQQVSSYSGLKRADLDGRLLMLGEFNGDGKPDFLLSPKLNASDWYIYYATGNGQFEKNQVSIYPRDSSYSYFLQDVNSDGLTDVIEYTSSCFYTYRARNGGFSSYESYKPFAYSNSYFIPTDINSLYSYSQLIALKDGKVRRYSYPRNDTKEKLLTGSVSSFGVIHKNYYSKLNESSGFYTQGFGAVYPFENFQGSLFVPVYREQYFNGQRNEDLFYRYENAVIHKQGLGFRGFEKITTYDNIRGRTGYQKYDPFKFCELKEEDSPVAKNTFTYSYDLAANKIAKVRLINKTSQDKLKNITISAAYTYDTYGNQLTETVSYGGGISESVTNAYFNNTNETAYLLGFLTDRTKTTNRNGATWSERNYIQSHDSKGQPNVAIRYVNGLQVSYETFNYNSQGNKTSHGVKSYSSINTLTANYVYDSYGRLTKKTDPLGFNTTYEYNATNGSLSKMKNHKDQSTVYYYDPFFRISDYGYPEGTTGSVSYSWNAVGTNGLYCIQKWEMGKPWSKTYFDALGRETAFLGLNFDYSEPRVEKQYDSYGRLQKVSLPYLGTIASYWNTYQYDNYDRIINLTEASGRITSYSYSGNSITTTQDGIASTQYFDTQGNLTSVSDAAGTISYNLRADGQPSSISAPGSVTTSFEYDSYGRRLSIADPSAGTQSFEYDIHGNIAKEKDANGKIISYGYDSYNRLKEISRPEFSTTYLYNSEGLLESETSTNGTSIVNTYDTYGRLQKNRETTVDGKWLEKTHTYGESYLQSTLYTTQSGNIVTENYYYDAGHLKEIKLNGTTSIWKLNSVNTFGQPTKTINRFVTRDYEYTNAGILTREKATTNANGVFFDYSYNINAVTGNMNFRKDNRINKQEDFTYDNLNRLKTYFDGSVTYDSQGKGNIISKTEAGNNFQYTNIAKPYAITGATATSFLIPQREQTVTYTSFSRPATITENGYKATFSYNASGNRVKMSMSKDNILQYNRYYIGGCYELDENANGTSEERLYLGGDAASATSLYLRGNNGGWYMVDICRNYQGTVVNTIDVDGSAKHPRNYTAWGLERNDLFVISATPYYTYNRGYCGHEHLKEFGLINMNARLYDPALGRFLSPDPFVQSPLFSQSFNRYSYCLNNPLKYTDPDGEWGWIAAGFGFAYGYVSYGLTKGNWGWKAVANGALTGVMWGIGYTGGMSQLAYAGQSALTSTVNSFMPSVSIPIGNNFSINTSFGLGVSPSGLVGGMNFSGTYHNGDFALTGGLGASSNMSSWGVGASYKDVGVSYYRTTFGNATGPDGNPNNQKLGGYGINIGDFSFRLENDLNFKIKGVELGGDGGDRWRTSAVEFGYKNFVLGTSVYTNAPDGTRDDGYSSFWKRGKQAYSGSTVFNSPLYIGVKHGGNVTRIGLNQPWIQDMTQNGVHLFLSTSSPLFHTPYGAYSSAYRYSGYYNPYSLFYR